MAWDGIRKTGSLCLMIVFLATGALAQSTGLSPLQISVISTFNEASPAIITPIDLPNLIMAVQDADDDIEVWSIYEKAFIDRGLAPDFGTYCVVSETAEAGNAFEEC